MQKSVMQQPNNPSKVNLESIEVVMERDTPEIVEEELAREKDI